MSATTQPPSCAVTAISSARAAIGRTEMAIARPETLGGAGSDGHATILVVDDEASYREALEHGLGAEGFHVVVAADGREALGLFDSVQPDLVLLDVMLPDTSGIDLCQQLRLKRRVPVIMVSARDSEIDIVLGLEFGAADYVAKPFRLRELVARMRAVLRRGSDPGVVNDQIIEIGAVRIDADRRATVVDGSVVDLSRKEFDLLFLFMSRVGQVVTREECIDQLWWDQDLADTRTLDTHVKRLRRKVESDPTNPRHLITVRGIGFRFDP